MSSETVVMHKSKGLSHLIYDAQRGDSEAVRALLGACQADARRYAYKHCHASDIDDAVQESLLLITRKIHALRATAAFSSWLFIVIKRECRRLSRAMFRQAPLEEDLAEQRLACKSDDDLRLDLAAAEKINPSYVSRILRLAYLSPKIVQAILDGKQPAWLTMKDLLRPLPADWIDQEQVLLCNSVKIEVSGN